MTITLPDELRDELERKTRAAGFATIPEYLLSLVSKDESPNPPPGARYAIQTREELEAKLLEGLNREGDVTAGPDFWAGRRQATEARAADGPRRDRSSGPTPPGS